MRRKILSSELVGSASYTTPGTYTWVAPDGVTSVCAVCIGAGADSYLSSGGDGGALAYKNDIAVTPGNSYTVFVPAGGSASRAYFINTETVSAGNGSARTGDGGGNGGTGATYNSDGGDIFLNISGSGGGAGGYLGAGGNGTSSLFGAAGSTGAGGTTGGTAPANPGGSYPISGAGGGGGISIFGTSGGVTLPQAAVGENGGDGNTYGGGGGARGIAGPSDPGDDGAGAGGAVRLVWGANKSFPSNAT